MSGSGISLTVGKSAKESGCRYSIRIGVDNACNILAGGNAAQRMCSRLGIEEDQINFSVSNTHKSLECEIRSPQDIAEESVRNVLVEVFHSHDWQIFKFASKKPTVLVFNNDFHGSYDSNQHYHVSLCEAMRLAGANVLVAHTFEEGAEIVENVEVDFSIAFGKFLIEKNGRKFYDQFNIHHFQWVSDNPWKLPIDSSSTNITYIFIDNEFPMMCGSLANRPLILPLGVDEFGVDGEVIKQDAIVFPGQIRNVAAMMAEIDACRDRDAVHAFLDSVNLDDSYIRQFRHFVANNMIVDVQLFFRLTNSYLRAKKRCLALESIRSKPVIVLGDCQCDISNPQVKVVPCVSHEIIVKALSAYRYVLNVDPNYYASIHERILLGIAAGSVCVSNLNSVVSPANGFRESYQFNDNVSIDDVLTSADKIYQDVRCAQSKFAKGFDWRTLCGEILERASQL